MKKPEGRFGLYEALDYTASRVPNGQTHAVVRSFMAHHQGMSLLSLAYPLLDRPMQRRFNANPLFKSAELLLHERVPQAKLPCFIRMNSKPISERESPAPAGINLARVHRSQCRAAGSPSAFQRPLSRHGHEFRRRLQPLERYDDDALAGRCDARQLGDIFLSARRGQRRDSGRRPINRHWKTNPVMKPFSARRARNFARA